MQPSRPAISSTFQFSYFVWLGFFPFDSKSSRGDEFENFSGAWCVCVFVVFCLHMEALCLLPLWMTFPPTLSLFTHPFPRILWSPAFLGAAYDFPREGLCIFWLNDSLHISSPTLSPFGCTSAFFLAPGAFFSRRSVSSSASSAPTPARPSLCKSHCLTFSTRKHSSKGLSDL